MAKDTKSINVHPDNDVAAINFFQNFGWELFSTQEVKNTSTYLKDSVWTDNIKQVTETEHYVKLTFQRDSGMPNYSKLVQLENEYNAVRVPVPPNKPNLLIFLGIPLVLSAIFTALTGEVIGTILGLIAVAGGVFLFVKQRQAYNVKLAEYGEADRLEEENKKRILRECQQLI